MKDLGKLKAGIAAERVMAHRMQTEGMPLMPHFCCTEGDPIALGRSMKMSQPMLRRMKDVGKSKANIAAERVMARVEGVKVTPHFCRIEEKPLGFFQDFHIWVLWFGFP